MVKPEASTVFSTLTDPQFVAGRSLVVSGRLEEAVGFFSELLEDRVSALGDEMSASLAPLYFEYGNALLYYAEESGAVFGDAITDAEKQKAIAMVEAKMSGEVSSGKIDGEGGGDDGGASGGNQQTTEAEAEEDLEIAWENLEIARKIYMDQPLTDEIRGLLGKVHLRLGDLNMLNGMYKEAAEEFEKCAEYRLSITGSTTNRGVADVHVRRAQAIFYASTLEGADKDALLTQARGHYESAMTVLEKMVAELVASSSADQKNGSPQTHNGQGGGSEQALVPAPSDNDELAASSTDKGKGKGKARAMASTVAAEVEEEPTASGNGGEGSIEELKDLLDTIRETVETLKSGKDMEALAEYKNSAGLGAGGATTVGFGAPGEGGQGGPGGPGGAGTTTVGFGSPTPSSGLTDATLGSGSASTAADGGSGGKSVMLVKRKPKP
ncbi:unnamed protein product, partial [Discosporangium mesarthrocarpum]